MELLYLLASTHGYVACDTRTDRANVRALEDHGWAEWRGDSWGSHFYGITELGRAKVAEWSAKS